MLGSVYLNILMVGLDEGWADEEQLGYGLLWL